MAYNLGSDTYACDICGFEMQWDASDLVHGEMWGYEKCGDTFCSKCFIDRYGHEEYMRMMQQGDLIYCSSCWKKAQERRNNQNKWENLFDQFLNTIEFQLVKYPDGWGLVDKQGANLGEIESERFDDAATIIDRLDIYTEDYFVDDICETMDRSASEDWSKLLQEARVSMAPKELEYHRFDLDVLEMICGHPHEINLENCCFTKEE